MPNNIYVVVQSLSRVRLLHARLLCLPLFPGVCSNSYPKGFLTVIHTKVLNAIGILHLMQVYEVSMRNLRILFPISATDFVF